MNKTRNLSCFFEAVLVKGYFIICRQNGLLLIPLFWSSAEENMGLSNKHQSKKKSHFKCINFYTVGVSETENAY